MLGQLWSKWKNIATRIGNFQARVFFSLFYFIIVTPFGLAVRYLSDPLRIKQHGASTFWHPKALPDPTLEEARRQG